MSKCDCCGCVFADDYGTSTVSGTGSSSDPFTVTRTDPSFVRPAVGVSRAGLGSLPNNTPTAVPWTTEGFDTNNMWAVGNPTRIVFQTAGVYQFGAWWQWASNNAGRRGAEWYLVSAGSGISTRLIDESVDPVSETLNRQLNYQWYFEVGDYIELLVMQSSGGALTLNYANGWAVYMGRKV